MQSQPLLASLLRYKASANDELLVALAQQETAPTFETAMRILHHAHIVDRIFVANLQRLKTPYMASWTTVTPPLERLQVDIRETDQWYIEYLWNLASIDLDEELDFSFTDGEPGRMSRAEMLAHVVTHSGYHRGEIGRLLPETGATGSRDVFAGYLHRVDPRRRTPSRTRLADADLL